MDDPGQQTIRILQCRFSRAEEFLRDLRPDLGEGGAIYYRTKMSLLLEERVILEVLFPGLPNRVLLRGTVMSVEAEGPAVVVEVDPEDFATLGFLVQVATGQVGPSRAALRRHDRIPLEVAVDWQVAGAGDVIVSATDDVGGGGVQIRTASPPPVGSRITLNLAPEEGGDPIRIRGEVAWVRDDNEFKGMGVKFQTEDAGERKRVRDLLRRILARGEVGGGGR